MPVMFQQSMYMHFKLAYLHLERISDYIQIMIERNKLPPFSYLEIII